MLEFTKITNVRFLAGAAAALGLGVSLLGCQSNAKQAAAFGSGADRPPPPRTLHMMAKLSNENGRFDQAEYVLTRIITDTPEYLPAYVELADLYIERQRFSDAVAILQNARSVAPSDPVIANNLGVLLLREKDFAGASEVFRAAVTQNPEEARYHANFAVSLAMQGLYEQAYMAWCAALPPEEVFWNIGVVAEARGDQAIASEYYAHANTIRKGVRDGDATVIAGEFLGEEYGPLPSALPSSPLLMVPEAEQTATVSVPVE